MHLIIVYLNYSFPSNNSKLLKSEFSIFKQKIIILNTHNIKKGFIVKKKKLIQNNACWLNNTSAQILLSNEA